MGDGLPPARSRSRFWIAAIHHAWLDAKDWRRDVRRELLDRPLRRRRGSSQLEPDRRRRPDRLVAGGRRFSVPEPWLVAQHLPWYGDRCGRPLPGVDPASRARTFV